MNRLARTGDTAEPYEQGWVMRSAVLPGLVTAMLAVEHCA
jgi:hypothetical protein